MKKLILPFVLFLNLLYSSNVYAQNCIVYEDYRPFREISYASPSTYFHIIAGYVQCFATFNLNTGHLEFYGSSRTSTTDWYPGCTCNLTDRTWFRRLVIVDDICNRAGECDINSNTTFAITDANSTTSTWSQGASWLGAQVPNLGTTTVFIDKANFSIDANNLVVSPPNWLVITKNRNLDINAGINFTCNSVIQFHSGGQLTNHGNFKGSGEIIGNFVHFINFGHFAPGNSAGTFTITGDYTAQSTAVHDMEIASSSSYDIINVSGIATLGGTLNMSLLNSFVPNIGDQFTLMTYGSKTGTFSMVNLPTLPAGRFWHLTYNPTNIVLEVLSSALSVELLDFKAKNTEGGNVLTWQTANEVNNKGFQIERSFDGKVFENIGFVKAKGVNSTYEFTDDLRRDAINRVSTTVYYRLHQIDNDGKETVSKVVNVTLLQKGLFVKTYPNPFSNSLILDLSTDKKTDVTIELIDILGRQVFVKKVENTEGVLSVPISTVGLPNGTYFLKVSNGQQVIQQKVIKE